MRKEALQVSGGGHHETSKGARPPETPPPQKERGLRTLYDQIAIEERWHRQWSPKLYRYNPRSNKPIYSIDTPPRYVSAPLHIGHATSYAQIDFVARYKRMRGYNVFFPLCVDANGLPIEVAVERQLGKKSKELDRHAFVKRCEEFADRNMARVREQFTELGMSMDPSIFYRTDAPEYRRLTQISFIDLYKKGLIYRGEHPINWCPRCRTALADAEVEYRERDATLYYINFEVDGEPLPIATTRPELIPTCQMVAIHPEDPRCGRWAGRVATTPLGKKVDIVADSKVDPDFGTGVVMVCSIGDREDLEWIRKYDLPIQKGIDEGGKLTDVCGKYAGLSIKDGRGDIVSDLAGEGLLFKQEQLKQSVGTCWRCHTPTEFLISPQWFLRTLDQKKQVLEAADAMEWVPERMRLRLQRWVESLRWDWVISRQRYFATPIPLWICERCGQVVIAEKEQCYVDPTTDPPPVSCCPQCGGSLGGSEEVFDTWMDSSITPLYNAGWPNQQFKELYPMSLRPHAPDIIRTWTFYSILRCLLLAGERPFDTVMVSGFILAPDGRPMHASWGNVIDPLEILKENGSDALRYFAANCVLGEDTPFRWNDVKRGGKTLRKLWNVEEFIGRVVEGEGGKIETIEGKTPRDLQMTDRWILTKYSALVESVTESMDRYRFSDALRATEFFMWHELADHYIEMAKSRAYAGDEGVRYTLYRIGLGIAQLLAPFFPHIAEEIYDRHYQQTEGAKAKSIHLSRWPTPILRDEQASREGEIIKDIIQSVREWKSQRGIALSAPLDRIRVATSDPAVIERGRVDILGTTHTKELVVSKDTETRGAEVTEIV